MCEVHLYRKEKISNILHNLAHIVGQQQLQMYTFKKIIWAISIEGNFQITSNHKLILRMS